MTWPTGAWPTARAAGDADVIIFGDSITSGQSATNYRTRSYASGLRINLRDRYGDGGSGFTPPWTDGPGRGTITGGSASSAFVSSVPNGYVVILSGALHATFWAEGTSVAVYLRRATGDGTARWRVDGGPWESVVCTGAAGYIRAAADGLEPGEHTVELEAVSGTIALSGIEGRNVTGCRVHNMGVGGRTSGGNSFWGAASDAVPSFRAATLTRFAPHLVVFNVGVNDSNSENTTPATYQANLDALIQAARVGRSDCDIVLVANHLGRFADHGYDDMRAALHTLADLHGGLVVDLDAWARSLPDGSTTARTAADPTGTSWGRWSTWGWWYDHDETVHPGDTGHFVLTQVLTDVLTAPETGPPIPPPDGGDTIELGGILT